MKKAWKGHKRIVRGEAVHLTQDEKLAMSEKEIGAEERASKESDLTIRQRVEEKYLSPDVSLFVETPEVKKIVDQVNFWLGLGYPVQIIGPTGCGKTALATYAARQKGPVVWINGDEQMSTADLIGGYVRVEKESVRDKFIHNVFKDKDAVRAEWVDNVMTIACKYGYALVYNEFSRSKPVANNILLSILEEKILEMPTKFGEEKYVKVHPNFTAIFTSNSTEYAGIHKPQDALLDRMINIYMDYYDFDTEVKIAQSHVSGASGELVRKAVGIVRELRTRLPEAQQPGTRACIMLAKGMHALNGGNNGAESVSGLCLNVIGSKVGGRKEFLEKRQLVEEVVRNFA